MEVKKKKSETTLQQTETNESHPKFIEMQKQIQSLTTEIKLLKTCNTLSNHNNNKSTEITEQNPKTTPFLLQPPSHGKHCKFLRRENATNLQPPKNLWGASAQDSSVTKQEARQVLKFIQNTMQTLTVFQKQFKKQ